jgi:hypothetical protein
MSHVKITRNGMTVYCYGEWQEDSNCSIVGDWANGAEMNEIWAGDGWPHEGMPTNWNQVVEHLTAWAKRNGHTIYELSAC